MAAGYDKVIWICLRTGHAEALPVLIGVNGVEIHLVHVVLIDRHLIQIHKPTLSKWV